MAETKSVDLVYVDENGNQTIVYPRTTMDNIIGGYNQSISQYMSNNYINKDQFPVSPYNGGTGNGTGYILNGKKDGSNVGTRATIEGIDNISSATGAHSEGYNNTSSGDYSHSEGTNTTASGRQAHAEGEGTIASGLNSHSEGYNTKASGNYSHAEGHSSYATGNVSHAEGSGTDATLTGAHSEGIGTKATSYGSHSEGRGSIASGEYSHAEGEQTRASGEASHTSGYGTIAGYDSQFVCGKYNSNYSDSLFEIGNGTSDSSRSTVFRVKNDGSIITLKGEISPSTNKIIDLGSEVYMGTMFATFARNANDLNITYYAESIMSGNTVIGNESIELGLPPVTHGGHGITYNCPVYMKVEYLDSRRGAAKIVASPALKDFYCFQYTWYGYYVNENWYGFRTTSAYEVPVLYPHIEVGLQAGLASSSMYSLQKSFGASVPVIYPMTEGYYQLVTNWGVSVPGTTPPITATIIRKLFKDYELTEHFGQYTPRNSYEPSFISDSVTTISNRYNLSYYSEIVGRPIYVDKSNDNNPVFIEYEFRTSLSSDNMVVSIDTFCVKL